jgi:hypothetical protein
MEKKHPEAMQNIYEVYLKPVLTYMTETWPVTNRYKSKIQPMDMTFSSSLSCFIHKAVGVSEITRSRKLTLVSVSVSYILPMFISIFTELTARFY